jgi:hypothetical protein
MLESQEYLGYYSHLAEQMIAKMTGMRIIVIGT